MLQLDEEAALETTQSIWYDATTPVGVVELVQLTQRGAPVMTAFPEGEERVGGARDAEERHGAMEAWSWFC